MLDPKTFPNQWKFLHRYCDPKFDGFGWTFKGLTNEDELKALINPLIHSVKKRDVLKDLPDRQINTVAMEVTDTSLKNEYIRASKKFLEWVNNTKSKKNHDGKMHVETLRSLAFQMKRDSVVEWIDDFIQDEDKLIVFCVHTNAIDDLSAVFQDQCVVIALS